MNKDGRSRKGQLLFMPEKSRFQRKLSMRFYGQEETGKLEVTVKPKEGITLEEQLKEAIRNIHGTITELELSDTELEEDVVSIPADPDVKNFSFTVVNEEVYYR